MALLGFDLAWALIFVACCGVSLSLAKGVPWSCLFWSLAGAGR